MIDTPIFKYFPAFIQNYLLKRELQKLLDKARSLKYTPLIIPDELDNSRGC